MHFNKTRGPVMKTFKFITLAIVVLSLVSCSPSSKVLNSWVNKPEDRGQTYSKIFFIALTENQIAKNIIESDLASAAAKLGFQTATGSGTLKASFTKENAPSKEMILEKVKELNCDLIFVVSLLDSKTETRYVPGSSYYYAPYPTYGYYGGFGSYYGYYAPMVYNPGYYTTDKIYYIEGSLFDVSTEKILWVVQSETYNPSSIKEFSDEYSQLIINQAYEDGLLKKKQIRIYK